MSDSHVGKPESGPLQGGTFRPATIEELAEAIEVAFDYRGDVTLELCSGGRVEGYVFNRLSNGSGSYLQVFPKGESSSQDIPYDQIAAIAFTGEDTASGKSWEAWVAKKESQRRQEAERIAQAARERGHL